MSNPALLVGRGVFASDGAFIGRVLWVRAPRSGESGIVMLVRTSPTSAVEVGWDKIASAKDIVVTKPGVDLSEAKRYGVPSSGSAKSSVLPQGGGKLACPSCGSQAKWIKQYDRWYCPKEKKYL